MVVSNESNYGAIYTPSFLSEFAAQLLKKYATGLSEIPNVTAFDPASGDGALLRGFDAVFGKDYSVSLFGNDIDRVVVENNKRSAKPNFHYENGDFLLSNFPSEWLRTNGVRVISSNPPWSGEKAYEDAFLQERGFELATGQYDSYVLFIEKVLKQAPNGTLASFIIPDSIFSNSNVELRNMILNHATVNAILRLGEGLFEGVYRSTVILVVTTGEKKKAMPFDTYRLSKANRQKVLAGELRLIDDFNVNKVAISQDELTVDNFSSAIDADEKMKFLIEKLHDSATIADFLDYHRGAEISKTGLVVRCDFCGYYQPVTQKQIRENAIISCANCGRDITVTDQNTTRLVEPGTTVELNKKALFLAGEDLHRYSTLIKKTIKLGKLGINYKEPFFYKGKKIAVRKTGLGINAAMVETDIYMPQSVHFLTVPALSDFVEDDLYGFLAIINSRLALFYNLMATGNIEWKSHPYLTKKDIMTLPVPRNFETESWSELISISKTLMIDYSFEVDMKIEQLIFNAFGLSQDDVEIVKNLFEKLPDIEAFKTVKRFQYVSLPR